jgi:hypothetical protein
LAAAEAALRELKAFTELDKQAKEAAGEDSVSLEISGENYEYKGETLAGFTARWTTGEGMAECGGDDLNRAVWLLFDPTKNRLAGPPTDIYGMSEVSPIDVDGDGKWELWTRDWTGSTSIRRGDAAVCEAEVAFCDCAC